MIDVLTWNVLHRVHAVNWDESSGRTYPNEAERTAAIAERVVALLEVVDVVALQEVSGDQLERIRARLGDHACFTHRHPRVPSFWKPSDITLEDPGEHLVLLVRAGKAARLRGGEAFPSDPGKGFLAVDVEGTPILATHVSKGPRREAQLARLLEAAEGAIVLGDFNAGTDVIAAAFEGRKLSSQVDPSPTRIGYGEHPPTVIDHVVATNVVAAEVLDGEGLSDHRPVRAGCT